MVFCRELGILRLRAQGIRQLSSKLRFSIKDYSLAELDLIRAKNGWKLTGAKEIKNYYSILKDKKEALNLVHRIFSVVSRYTPEEEKNPNLFDYINSAVSHISSDDKLINDDDYFDLECIIVINILHELGYFAKKEEFKNFIDAKKWEPELFVEMKKIRNLAIKEINLSLKASHL